LADYPTKPAIPLAEAVTIGYVSNGIVQKLVIKRNPTWRFKP